MVGDIDYTQSIYEHIVIRDAAWSEVESFHCNDMTLAEALALFFSEFDVEESLLISLG